MKNKCGHECKECEKVLKKAMKGDKDFLSYKNGRRAMAYFGALLVLLAVIVSPMSVGLAFVGSTFLVLAFSEHIRRRIVIKSKRGV